MSGLLKKLPVKLTNKKPAKVSNSTRSSIEKPSSTLKPISNHFTKLLSVTKYLPASARSSILSKAFGKVDGKGYCTQFHDVSPLRPQVVVGMHS